MLCPHPAPLLAPHQWPNPVPGLFPGHFNWLYALQICFNPWWQLTLSLDMLLQCLDKSVILCSKAILYSSAPSSSSLSLVSFTFVSSALVVISTGPPASSLSDPINDNLLAFKKSEIHFCLLCNGWRRLSGEALFCVRKMYMYKLPVLSCCIGGGHKTGFWTNWPMTTFHTYML